MRHSHGTFTNEQGLRIFCQQWLPEQQPRAGLLLVHGMSEHSGRYGNLVSHLVPRGYAVFALDHPGHGRSEGSRAHVRRFRDFVATLRQYSEAVRAAHPTLPWFLYGHSMGGLIGIHFLPDEQDRFRGAVLSAPPVSIPSHVSRRVIFLGRLLSRLLPKVRVAPLDSSGISRDPRVVRAYDTDPLIFRGKATTRLAAELMGAIKAAPDAARRIRLPTLLLQGTADPIVDPGDAPLLYDQLLGSADKTLRCYPGLYHEVHNEPEQAEVLSDVQAWLTAHL